jgi:hypothetical protein
MAEFSMGLLLGFALAVTFIVPSTDPALDWYEGDKHIQPWSKLSPEEQEQWRKLAVVVLALAGMVSLRFAPIRFVGTSCDPRVQVCR